MGLENKLESTAIKLNVLLLNSTSINHRNW